MVPVERTAGSPDGWLAVRDFGSTYISRSSTFPSHQKKQRMKTKKGGTNEF